MNQKAMLLASDVLGQLSHNSIEVCGSNYVGMRHRAPWLPEGIQDDRAKDHVEKLQSTCRFCAIGCLFLASARQLDVCTVKEFLISNGRRIKQLLSDVFSAKQLGLIECAFMRSTSWAAIGTTLEEAEHASLYGPPYDAPERLRLIMENILRHDGTFDHYD